MLKLFTVISIGNSPVNKQALLSIGRIKQVYTSNSTTIISYVKSLRTQETVNIVVSDSVSAVQAKMAGFNAGGSFVLPFTENGLSRTDAMVIENIAWVFASANGSTLFYEVSNSLSLKQYLTSRTLTDLLTLSGANSEFLLSVEARVGTNVSVDGDSNGITKVLDVVAGVTVPFIFHLQKSRTSTVTINVTSTIVDVVLPIVITPDDKDAYLFEFDIQNIAPGQYPVTFDFSDTEGNTGTRTILFNLSSAGSGSGSGSGSGGGAGATYDVDNSASKLTLDGVVEVNPGTDWSATQADLDNITLKGFGTGHVILGTAATIQLVGAYYVITITAGTVDGFPLTSGLIVYQSAVVPANGQTNVDVQDIQGANDSNVVVA